MLATPPHTGLSYVGTGQAVQTPIWPLAFACRLEPGATLVCFSTHREAQVWGWQLAPATFICLGTV